MPIEEFDDSIYKKSSSQQETNHSNFSTTISDGSNLRIHFKLTLKEMFKGLTKHIKYKRFIVCSHCNGIGIAIEDNIFLLLHKDRKPCKICQGDGRIRTEETLSIEIPAATGEGMKLKMSGKGNAGIRGGKTGDLIIIIEEERDYSLCRDGLNVAYELDISFFDAVFGKTIEVPTLTGSARIKIPAGTQSGKVFKLKEKGFPDTYNGKVGDQLIFVNVWIPQNLSNFERTTLETLQGSHNFKPQFVKNEKTIFDKIKMILS